MLTCILPHPVLPSPELKAKAAGFPVDKFLIPLCLSELLVILVGLPWNAQTLGACVLTVRSIKLHFNWNFILDKRRPKKSKKGERERNSEAQWKCWEYDPSQGLLPACHLHITINIFPVPSDTYHWSIIYLKISLNLPIWKLETYFFSFFFLNFWPYPWHVEVPWPGIQSRAGIKPKLLQWQCWDLNLLSHRRTPWKLNLKKKNQKTTDLTISNKWPVLLFIRRQ